MILKVLRDFKTFMGFTGFSEALQCCGLQEVLEVLLGVSTACQEHSGTFQVFHECLRKYQEISGVFPGLTEGLRGFPGALQVISKTFQGV